jgi:hypothetical protein
MIVGAIASSSIKLANLSELVTHYELQIPDADKIAPHPQ